jgi:hypothetical protein
MYRRNLFQLQYRLPLPPDNREVGSSLFNHSPPAGSARLVRVRQAGSGPPLPPVPTPMNPAGEAREDRPTAVSVATRMAALNQFSWLLNQRTVIRKSASNRPEIILRFQ